MLNNCYTFNELKEKYGWKTSEGSIKAQIRYAKNRGVTIEKAFKEGKTYFYLISDESGVYEEWKEYPKNPRYEVSNKGQVRVKENKKMVGAKNIYGYIIVVDQTQHPVQYYRVNRMVLETFHPIENDDKMIADHINGIKTDNNLTNLRWVTQRQNCFNRDENYAKINENYQKLIEIYGYDGLNAIFEAILAKK